MIDKKIQESGSSDIQEYKDKYEAALNGLTNNSGDIEHRLRALKGCARGYMEVSSNYMDPFLNEMGATEEMIKKLGL